MPAILSLGVVRVNMDVKKLLVDSDPERGSSFRRTSGTEDGSAFGSTDDWIGTS